MAQASILGLINCIRVKEGAIFIIWQTYIEIQRQKDFIFLRKLRRGAYWAIGMNARIC